MKRVDRTGQRYGLLVATRLIEGTPLSWECRCDCGSIVVVRGNNLKSGNTTSCGVKHRSKREPRPLPPGVLVDPQDHDLVSGISWHISDTGYAVNRSGGKTIRMHRLITNAPPGLDVDHINGNPLDNRRVNLRVVHHAVNTQNLSKKRKNNTSGFRGVTFARSVGKWAAQVTHRYRRRVIGYFDTAEAAGAAAEAWRRENMEAYR